MGKTTDWHLISFFVFPHKTCIKKTRIEISILPAGAPGFFISERQQHKFTHFQKVSLQEKIHNSNDSDSNEQPFILALTHKHVLGRIVPSICIIKTRGFDVGMTILLRVRKSSQLFHSSIRETQWISKQYIKVQHFRVKRSWDNRRELLPSDYRLAIYLFEGALTGKVMCFFNALNISPNIASGRIDRCA